MTKRRHGLRHSLFGLACGLVAALAFADEPCRVAFDMGSSGIRAGYSGSAVTTRAGIDYLAPLWAGHGLEPVVLPTIRALRHLPEEGRFPEDCARVGGGFSAWRLALQQDPGALVAILAQPSSRQRRGRPSHSPVAGRRLRLLRRPPIAWRQADYQPCP